MPSDRRGRRLVESVASPPGAIVRGCAMNNALVAVDTNSCVKPVRSGHAVIRAITARDALSVFVYFPYSG